MHRREDGFTLLEVIIAFAIMALLMGVSFETFSVGLRNVGAADGYAGAVMRAEQKISLMGVSDPISPGVITGRFDENYTWRLEVHIEARDESAVEGADTLPLYAVELTTSWGGRTQPRSLVLRTHRLGGGSPP